jgi:hypothetical protein
VSGSVGSTLRLDCDRALDLDLARDSLEAADLDLDGAREADRADRAIDNERPLADLVEATLLSGCFDCERAELLLAIDKDLPLEEEEYSASSFLTDLPRPCIPRASLE